MIEFDPRDLLETPYNFCEDKSKVFSAPHVIRQLTEFKEEHGFTGWGFATWKRAKRHGYRLENLERWRYCDVEFANGYIYRYYHKSQFYLSGAGEVQDTLF